MLPFIKTDLVINGIPLSFLTHRDDLAVGKYIRMGISWDINLEVLQGHLKPHARVLDAGANIGMTAVFMAKCQPTATIYAFEPDPLNFSLLNMNIALNGVTNVLVFNCALGKTQQYISFYRNNINHGDHRSSRPFAHEEAAYFSTHSNKVPVVNPVDFLNQCQGEQAPLYFDLLKVDTQGADLDIIEACQPLLRKHSVIVAEFSPPHLRSNGTLKEDVKRVVGRFSRIEKIHHQPPALAHEIQLQDLLDDYDNIEGFHDLVLRHSNPFNSFEKSVHSQNGEDGLIEHIFSVIGSKNHYFVEFGTGGGLENNSANLILNHRWSGLLIEGSETLHRQISVLYAHSPQVKVINRFITKENISEIFGSMHVPMEFDLLSIDIDGNDYWVWQALHRYKPRVVIVEYNASYPPPQKKVITYNPNFAWNGTDYYGASLTSLSLLGKKLGYALIGTESRGVNAFFVRRDLLSEKGIRELIPEEAYHYPAYGPYQGGHYPAGGGSFYED